MGRQTQDVSIYDEDNGVSAKVTSDGKLKVDAQVSTSQANSLKSIKVSVSSLTQLPDYDCSYVVIRPEDGGFITNIVYIGGSDLTTSNGFPVYGGESITIDISNSNQIYLITDGTSVDVNVLIGVE